jgi:UDP-glucose 4-epimerase
VVGEAFNLGGEARSLIELAQTLLRIHGSGSYRLVPYPEPLQAIEIGDYRADARRFTAAAGWRPRYDLEQGLRRTLEFYRCHGLPPEQDSDG